MYRQPPQIITTKTFLPSPISDDLSDSESALTADLDEKRREIKEEIEAFKLQKEQEFKLFKDELRSGSRQSPAHRLTHPFSLQSTLHILNKKNQLRDRSNERGRPSKADGNNGHGLKSNLGPSKPSVSLNRVTINGMTTPPVSSTPPLARSLSRSPVNLPTTPPAKSQSPDITSIYPDTENDEHAVINPDYFHLIDTRPSSLPQDSTIPPPLEHPRPALATLSMPSNSLPSAFRTASGTIRKRKHVMFRLADSAVVDPSSSYEETPSPSEAPSEEDLDDVERPPSPLELENWEVEPDLVVPSPLTHAPESSFFSFDEELGGNHPGAPNYQEHQYDEAEEPDDIEVDPKPELVSSSSFSCGSLPINIVKSGPPFKVALTT